jgi:hypothetical protein
MIDGNDDEAGTYVNLKTGFRSLMIVDGVGRLIYIGKTNMENEY